MRVTLKISRHPLPQFVTFDIYAQEHGSAPVALLTALTGPMHAGLILGAIAVQKLEVEIDPYLFSAAATGFDETGDAPASSS